jgi:CRISPR-associated protein Cas5d
MSRHSANARSSPPIVVRVSGELACFTRPEFKTERVSYPVITPSAARGVLEAILWKPAIRWRIRRIRVLAPIKYTSVRRNELDGIARKPRPSLVAEGGPFDDFYVETHRQQRNTLALKNVDYIIDADFVLSEQAGPADNVPKFVEIFQRRLSKGQHFHQPYLGCREFIAEVTDIPDPTPVPVDVSLDLGVMLWDMEWHDNRARPAFFRAKLEHGIVSVPLAPTEFPANGAT